MRRVLPAATLALAWACSKSDVTIAPPRVPQGGRAVAIAVSLADEKRIVVATESGGLFRTFNGGTSFQHLDAFPTFAPVDVAIASLDPNIIIATARDDFATITGGGIWRSTDGGASWKRPTGWPPPMSPTCGARPWARGISHIRLSRTFHVATDCGIAVSTDNGATFSMVVLNPSQPKVRGVLVTSRTTGVAADDTRLYYLNGGMWQLATGGPSSLGEHNYQNFAATWWTGEPIFYHAGRDREIYFSTDNGANWTFMATPPHGGGREKMIEVGRGLDGDPSHFDVYFGDGVIPWRQAVTTAVPGGTNEWRRPTTIDHLDPADIAFTPGFERPLMLATDGGVHLTPDNGKTWKLTGSGYGGFTALQIGEITGRAVGGAKPHLDLYYATQDNDIKGSSDGGQTWPGSLGEGAFLSADAANPAAVDGRVTGRQCGPCSLFDASDHLTSGSSNFRSAPNGNSSSPADPPVQLVGPTYFQHVPTTGPPASFDYYLTNDRGASWNPVFSLPLGPIGTMKFAGALDDPVAYVGVRRGGNAFGLYRIQNAVTQPAVRRADSTGFGSVGILRTFQGSYAVFGVDPSQPNQLIAADVNDSQMKASRDGGITWYPLPNLTTAVTDSARFLFSQDISSFATAIAWDPSNTCHILVGTMQNGVIRSVDGGNTWRRVAGSKVATYVTSFFFPPTGSIWMSTYGRGLWTINVDRSRPANARCAFPRPPGDLTPFDSLVVFMAGSGGSRPFEGFRDTLVCATCTFLTARNGWITDITVDGRVVKAVAISGGMAAERDRTGKEVPLSVPNSYFVGESPGLRRLLGKANQMRRRPRGIVLSQKQLVGIVMSRDELPWPTARTPMLYITNASKTGVPSVVEPGDSVAVHGYGFLPGTGRNGVNIVVKGDTVAVGVRVLPNGTFSVRLPVVRGPELLEVIAVQRDGMRITIEQGSITAVARERD